MNLPTVLRHCSYGASDKQRGISKEYCFSIRYEYPGGIRPGDINDQMFKTILTHLPVTVLEFVFWSPTFAKAPVGKVQYCFGF